jgi:hypothetical protein
LLAEGAVNANDANRQPFLWDPVVTSSFHPPKAAKTLLLAFGDTEVIKGTAKLRIDLVDAGRF